MFETLDANGPVGWLWMPSLTIGILLSWLVRCWLERCWLIRHRDPRGEATPNIALPSNIVKGTATHCFMSDNAVFAMGDFTLVGGARAIVIKFNKDQWVPVVDYAARLAYLDGDKWVNVLELGA